MRVEPDNLLAFKVVGIAIIMTLSGVVGGYMIGSSGIHTTNTVTTTVTTTIATPGPLSLSCADLENNIIVFKNLGLSQSAYQPYLDAFAKLGCAVEPPP